MLSMSPGMTAEKSTTPLEHSLLELRQAAGSWSVTTEFLNEDGSVARTAEGSYQFDWVIEDRVLQGRMEVPETGLASAILFYVREESEEIEMVSVGQDGRLWIMTGPLGGDTRYSQAFRTQSGGEGQLRFTRFNATPERFESRMEWTDDGGESWKPGNHQVFERQ
jgi:hypothetical protein